MITDSFLIESKDVPYRQDSIYGFRLDELREMILHFYNGAFDCRSLLDRNVRLKARVRELEGMLKDKSSGALNPTL